MLRIFRKGYLQRMIRMNALRKGLIGGSPVWRIVWGFLTVRKFWSKVSKRGEPPVVFTESIGEGDSWAVVHVPEDSKRGRGEGRRFLIGPKRKPPRTRRFVPPALSEAGHRILDAPSAERINEILGRDVVVEPSPSRSQRRAQMKSARRAAKV
ncbi:MAG: hypothetical protein ACR2P0_07185 [Acidimicrobiales bacterium]